MDVQKLTSLLSKEENIKLDFKQKLNLELESGKKELAKDVCAIANSRGGRGYIIIGVEDKTKKIIGIENDSNIEEKIQQIITTRLDPPIPIAVETMSYKNATIGIITIFTTDQKPHQLRETGAFYIRRGSTTDIMRREEIASMIQEIGLLNYELLPVNKASINEIDMDKVANYFSLSGIKELNTNNLITSGIIIKERDSDELHPTYGGLMLFGNNPQKYLSHCFIKIHNTIDYKKPSVFIGDGDILKMLKSSFEFIRSVIGDGYQYDVAEDYIGKAVLNRDYFDINNPIEIYVYRNNIEIFSPGAIVKSNHGKYIRRNNWLYLRLLSLDKDRLFFDRNINMDNFIRVYGKPKYYNLISKNIFKIIIPLKPNKPKK